MCLIKIYKLIYTREGLYIVFHVRRRFLGKKGKEKCLGKKGKERKRKVP